MRHYSKLNAKHFYTNQFFNTHSYDPESFRHIVFYNMSCTYVPLEVSLLLSSPHNIVCVFLFFIFMWKLLGMNIELRMDPWHYSIYFLGLFYSHLRHFYRWHEYLFCHATGSPSKSLCMEIETHRHSFSCYVNEMNYGYYNLLCYVLSTTTG